MAGVAIVAVILVVVSILLSRKSRKKDSNAEELSEHTSKEKMDK